MKTIFCCTNFGQEICDEEINAGDAIRYEIAAGPLHEICLLDNLHIPDLDNDEDILN